MKLKKDQMIEINWLTTLIYDIKSVEWCEVLNSELVYYDFTMSEQKTLNLSQKTESLKKEMDLHGIENIKIDGKQLEL